MAIIQRLIIGIRNVSSEMEVTLDKRLNLLFKIPAKEIKFLQENKAYFESLLKVESLKFSSEVKRPKFSCSVIEKDIEVYIPLEGIIDLEKEKRRLAEKLKTVEGYLEKLSARLKDKAFLRNAPKEIIDKDREHGKELLKEKTKWENHLKEIQR